ncbi:MAG: phosphate transport system permease protein [Actinomycetota bacterium]|jgi:phosphate transport system permease protein|nr:phosphate transport system permease protein [Actinomycetota bacterium]
MNGTHAASPVNPVLTGNQRRFVDRFGDHGLYVITLLSALGSVVIAGGLAYKVLSEARIAISTFGLGFLTTGNWDPVHNHFGAVEFIFGTAVSSFGALLIATPLSIAIALFLTELSPRRARTPIGILVELLAAIPSVILGLWGILILGPVLQRTIEPALHSALHRTPFIGNLFGTNYSIVGLFPAILILTIMTVPIVSSLTREIFATVPSGTKEASLALGATRWEMIKTSVLPYSRSGIIGAVILGLGRAVGEAIAVTQVIGGSEGIHSNIFLPADTLASRIAGQYQGATTQLQISSIAYLGAILLVLSVIFNGVARLLVRNARGRLQDAR